MSERKAPVHAKLLTTTAELGMALFEHFAPHAPFGRRQVKFRGQPVYGVNEVVRTMEEVSLLALDPQGLRRLLTV